MRTVEKGPPAAALAELKTYLRIEDGAQDALLAGLMRAATETVEAMLGLMLFEREVEERGFARCGAMQLSAEPARSLVAATLVADDGAAVPLAADAARFRVGRDGVGRLEVPGAADGAELVVRYRAGMAGDWNWVPEALRLAVMRAAAHFHRHRDDAADAGLPPAVRRMVGPWRTRRLH